MLRDCKETQSRHPPKWFSTECVVDHTVVFRSEPLHGACMISDGLQSRLAQIPIFKTLNLHVDGMGEGTAALTARYDPAYDGIYKSFHGGE